LRFASWRRSNLYKFMPETTLLTILLLSNEN
jgi:hypothetical protein